MHEGSAFSSQITCLDYIGKRGSTVGASKDLRVRHAKEVLQREVSAHVGLDEGSESRKTYFIGFMIHRLLLGKLGRVVEDDRDHYGKKRIDLAGALMASSFGQLFRKMVKDVRRKLQRQVDNRTVYDVAGTIRSVSQITQGIQYQLATGNWGKNKEGGVVRSGVSQVLDRLTSLSALSHSKRIITPSGREGKVAKPRQLHNTHGV